MTCKNCGADLQANSRFCSNCGTPVTTEQNQSCPACGAPLKANAKFCARCGQSVDAAQTVVASTPPPTTDEPAPSEARGRRSLVATLLPLLGIPALVGIIYLLTYKPSNPTPSQNSMSAGQSMPNNQQDPFDMAAMAPVFRQIDSLKNVVKENPKAVEALAHLAALFDMAGKYDQASGYYRDLLAVTPENVEARMNLAGAYFNMGNHEKALEELHTVLEHRPNYDYAMYNLGVIYAAIHQHEKSAEWWNKVIAGAPNSDLAQRAREGIEKLKHE